MPGTKKYDSQREKVTPPHVSLKDLRDALGWTIDQVIARITEEFPELKGTTRGAISGIENGHRGASAPMLRALCAAYGLPADAITTDYRPRGSVEAAA